jgi:putative sigma-54 modulation protein
MATTEALAERIYAQGVHLDLTEGMRQAIADKFRPIMRRSEEIIRLNVRVVRDQQLGESPHFSATAQLEIRGPDLVARAEGKDAYVILDELVEKLDHLLEKRQGRRREKRKHPHDIELDANLPKIVDQSAGEITP